MAEAAPLTIDETIAALGCVKPANTALSAGAPHRSASAPQTAFLFGVDHKRTTAALRELADRIEARQILLQEVTEVSRSVQDDFSMTWVTLQFSQRVTL